MKKLIIILVTFFTLQATAQTTTIYVEGQNYFSKGASNTFISSFISHQFKCGVGVWNYSQISNSWAESIIGLNYGKKIFDCFYVEVGSGFGVEKDYVGFRGSSYLSFINTPKEGSVLNQTSLYGNIEYLGSGSWYVAYIKHNITEHLSLGASIQSDATVGPRVDVLLGKFTLWTVPGYYLSTQDIGIQFGVGYSI